METVVSGAAVQGDDQKVEPAATQIVGPLLDKYTMPPHSHYVAPSAQGMVMISVGDLKIAAPSEVSLPVRPRWDSDLKPQARSTAAGINLETFLKQNNPE